MNGRPLAIPEIAKTAPAIVEAWQAGDRTGDALAMLLTGKANFSGKLPVSFPRFAGHKVYYNHPSSGRPAFGSDNDVIDPNPYRSRYYNAKRSNIDPVESTPLFAFGEGKSYTTYAYEDLKLSSSRVGPRGKIRVSARVTNTGAMAGDEVVQLYLRDDIRSTTPPVKELKAFRRVHLEPGESKTVEFTISRKELSFLDHTLKDRLEPGTFTVWIAPSSVGGLKGNLELTAR
jgi:beta-glucosidase